MAQKKGGLGKGLELLFAENALEDAGKAVTLPIGEIEPNRDQPRKAFDDAALAELSASIAQHGVLQPLLVRPMSGGGYQIVAGERRYRASRMAGLTELPAVIRELSDKEAAQLALIENLQREDMNCFETAAGLRSLIDTYGLTQDEAALRLGLSQSAVANKLRLLRLSPTEQKTVLENGMGERHARALLRLQKPEERQYALSEMARRHLNVAQSEALVEHLLAGKGARHRRIIPLPKDMRAFFNTLEHAVDIIKKGGVAAVSTRRETAAYIECVIRVPKPAVRQ